MAIVLGLFIATISIFVIGMVVSRIIQKERNQIGLLKGLGFTNSEITVPYVLLLAIISLPLLTLGYYLGYVLASPAKSVFLEFYLLPDLAIKHSVGVILVAIIVPFTFILLLSYGLINFLLRATPLEMMLPKQQKTNKYILRVNKYLKRFDIKKRFKFSMVFQSTGKFFVFIIGIVSASYMLIFSFMSLDIFDALIYDYYNNVEYVSEGYCEYTGCPIDIDGEYAVIMPSASYEDSVISLYGLEPDNTLHKLYNSKGDEITSSLDEGVVISEYMKRMEGVSVGDDIRVNVNNKSFTVEVVDVAYIFTGSTVYIDRSTLNEYLGLEKDYANLIYSDSILESDNFLGVSIKEDVLSQAESMQKFMNVSFIGFIITAAALGFIILYLIMSLTIEDNFYQISLLKVMGFDKLEVNDLVINSYLIYAVITYIVSLPIIYFSVKLMEIIYVKLFGLVMVFKLTPLFALLGLLIVIGMYFVGTIDAKRKIDKISLQESLKMYQE
ncbi:hypothetical protein KHQ82_10250 [Mycoplasmatota bacterium]|nr:hypothetical protein KHQ82_10250 [Mycoplasmatota bacterium]